MLGLKKKKKQEEMTPELAKRKIRRNLTIIGILFVGLIATKICNKPQQKTTAEEDTTNNEMLQIMNAQLDSIVKEKFDTTWIITAKDEPTFIKDPMEFLNEERASNKEDAGFYRRFWMSDTTGTPRILGIQKMKEDMTASELTYISKIDTAVFAHSRQIMEKVQKEINEITKQ